MGKLVNLPYKAIEFLDVTKDFSFIVVYHPKTLYIVEGPAKYVGLHLKELNDNSALKSGMILDFVAHPEEEVWTTK